METLNHEQRQQVYRTKIHRIRPNINKSKINSKLIEIIKNETWPIHTGGAK